MPRDTSVTVMVTVVVAVAPDGSAAVTVTVVLVVGAGQVLVVERRAGADRELAGCCVYGEQGGVWASEGVVESFVVGRGDGVADGVARGCVLGYGAGCRLAVGEGRQDVIGRMSIDGDAPRLDRAGTQAEDVGDAQGPDAVGVFSEVFGGAEAVRAAHGDVVVIGVVIVGEGVERDGTSLEIAPDGDSSSMSRSRKELCWKTVLISTNSVNSMPEFRVSVRVTVSMLAAS